MGKREWRWIAAAFLAALALGCRSVVSTAAFLAAAVFTVPSERISRVVHTVSERVFGRFSAAAAKALLAVLILLGLLLSPNGRSGDPSELRRTVTAASFAAWNGKTAAADRTPALEIDFLDVGQGDCALVRCGDHAMLIDGGGRECSSLVYAFLREKGIEYLDYIVVTHLHEDHLGGIAGALNRAEVGTLYCSGKANDSELYKDMVKYLSVQGKKVTVPKSDESFMLGDAEVELFTPLRRAADENNNSLVVRIVCGETSFLFMGDAETEEEADLIGAGHYLKSDVLKLAHHGSGTATSYRLLAAVYPKYAVISVGEGNPYSHPTADTLLRLQEARVTTYRTDRNGTVTCRSDGKTVTFTTERDCADDPLVNYTPGPDAAAAPKPTETAEPTAVPVPDMTAAPIRTEDGGDSDGMTRSADACDYIANRNSLVFHRPDCGSVMKMKEENKWYFFGLRDELISLGYKPCGRCNP